METKLEIVFLIRFDTDYESNIIFTSLLPEIKGHDFERSQVTISLTNSAINVKIKAYDINAAKATINSILRWISTTTRVISTFSKQT